MHSLWVVSYGYTPLNPGFREVVKNQPASISILVSNFFVTLVLNNLLIYQE